MAQYRFCGDSGVHGALRFDCFGQEFEMEQGEAEELAIGGFPILPEAEFATRDFTAKELEEFPTSAAHQDAPQEFQHKKMALLLDLYDFRKALIAAQADK